ncbi:MAG: YceD family protein [Solirubrobacterales bacterium]
MPSSTIIDLDRLSLAYGEGTRLDLAVKVGALELGGQSYALDPDPVAVRLDVSRPSRGYALRMRFAIAVEGPCMRCLEPARVGAEIDAREIDQHDTDDEELRSPYVGDSGELDLGRWAHNAAILALPTRIQCRADCAGLCPVCGQSLNDDAPGGHDHGTGPDPRWAKLRELKLE